MNVGQYKKILDKNRNADDCAPVVIFVYNRLEHTKRTIEALKNNYLSDKTDVYIYSDAPKNESNVSKVQEVRDYIESVDGFHAIEIVRRSSNYGLASNIMDGVTKVVNRYGRVIVLEDDIVTSKVFLKYMNDALDIYRDSKQVMEISGYAYPLNTEGLPETFFLHFGDCWGWATWKDRWDKFERNPEKLIQQFKKSDIYHFNLENSYNFWNQVIANKDGKLNTWAIFWTATIYLNKGLMLYPRESLVENVGFDASGDHKSTSKDYLTNYSELEITQFPVDIQEEPLGRERLKIFFKKIQPSIKERILQRLKRILKVKKNEDKE